MGSDANGDTINLEAAIAGVPISRLAVCEPPYPLDPKGSQNRGRLWFFRRLEAGNRDSATRAVLQISGVLAVAGQNPAVAQTVLAPARLKFFAGTTG